MELLPRTMGTRPRLALEVRPEGVVAARAEGGSGLLAAVARAGLRDGVLLPGLRTGNFVDRRAASEAVRKALEGVAAKGGERSKYVTLVLPDAAARVLLLDFDALPSKAAEALAVVRFRLKKLLPFDAEHAVLSYQVMSSGRDGLRLLAVAMPCDVLSEYEGMVTDAGYIPGAVLPSTLAALAGLDAGEDGTTPALVVNVGPEAVTTAIVQGGILLLHRTVDLRLTQGVEDGDLELRTNGSGEHALESRGRPAPAMRPSAADERNAADSRDVADSVDYDRMDAETEMQARVLQREVNPVPRSEVDEAVRVLNDSEAVSVAREITQAVSVAAAYFEDTLGGPPVAVLAAGTLGAERLSTVLAMYGMDGLRVREMVDATAIDVGASNSTVQHGWLAGVRGALRS